MAAHENEFFDVSRKLFTNRKEFDELSNNALRRNSFMMNRYIAIQYPDKAQAFNFMKINESDVMKFWADYLGNKSRVPGFMYTKGVKSSQKEASKKSKMPSNSLIKDFCLHYNLNRKDVINAIKILNNDEMINEIFEYEKLINQTKNI